MDIQGSKRYSSSLSATPNLARYQYTYITSSMISDEFELCSHETRFGQVASCGIHCSSGRGNSIGFLHCGGTKKEWEALSLRGFPKIERCHIKGSISFTFYRGSIRHGGKAWSTRFWMAFRVIIK